MPQDANVEQHPDYSRVTGWGTGLVWQAPRIWCKHGEKGVVARGTVPKRVGLLRTGRGARRSGEAVSASWKIGKLRQKYHSRETGWMPRAPDLSGIRPQC